MWLLDGHLFNIARVIRSSKSRSASKLKKKKPRRVRRDFELAPNETRSRILASIRRNRTRVRKSPTSAELAQNSPTVPRSDRLTRFSIFSRRKAEMGGVGRVEFSRYRGTRARSNSVYHPFRSRTRRNGKRAPPYSLVSSSTPPAAPSRGVTSACNPT